MKRSILLFLLAFLVTAGIVGGFYFYIAGRAPQPAAAEAEATPAPTQNNTPEASTPKPDTPAVTAPTDANKADESPAATPKPTEEPKPADNTTAENPTPQEPEQPTSTEPTPTPTPPTAEPKQPEVKLPEGVRPHNPAHESVLIVNEILKGDNAEAGLQSLIDGKKVAPEAADVIKKWRAENTPGEVQEVGDIRHYENDSKTFRYRIKSADGKNDLIVDVRTDKQGKNPYIIAANIVPSDVTDISTASDSMSVAEGFMEAARLGNMSKARTMVDGSKVSDATIAGLCMIFEEGTFGLCRETPIRNTVLNDRNAMYLVYVVPSHKADAGRAQANHIAMNLEQTGAGWRVTGIGMDNLLGAYEESAMMEGGRFFPIVKNPKGGDSLALFFAFDDASLTPRSERQLQIVAEILKQSKGKLDISGHTDDVGSEEYNLRLSEKRAEAVREVLIRFGVAPEQITTKGLGKNEPRFYVEEGDDETAQERKRGENRRAEIYLDFES